MAGPVWPGIVIRAVAVPDATPAVSGRFVTGPVSQYSSRQDERREHQCVAVDDPLHAAHAAAERGPDRLSKVVKVGCRASFCVIVSFSSEPGLRAEFRRVISLRNGDRQHV